MNVIDPAHQDEQGRRLAGPSPVTGGGMAAPTAVKSPLSSDNATDILGAAGLGAHRNVSQQQFGSRPQGSPGEGGPAEGAEAGEAGGEAAAGAGEAVDLLALAAL